MSKVKSIGRRKPPAIRNTVAPRAPSRRPGIIRYKALLDALELLLQSENLDDIGLYQIAKFARVPPASVYHFFPTKEAAFLALAQRYLDGFAQLFDEPIATESLVSWQSLFAWDLRRGAEYYNAHSPAAKLFLGGFGGIETRQADRQYVERVAAAAYQRLNSYFHMPFLREPEIKFNINLQIVDAIMSLSYLQFGKVTEHYRDEAYTASVAYCRTFLPEHLEQREIVRDAIARGNREVAIAKRVATDPD